MGKNNKSATSSNEKNKDNSALNNGRDKNHMDFNADRSKSGALLIILAGVCWGSISIFVNYLADAGLDSMQISFLRQTMAAVIFCIIMLMRDPSKFKISSRDIPILAALGIACGVMFNFFYFYTIVNSRASIAVVLLYTSPIFVMIMARIFFKERFNKYKITALVMTVAGCIFVTGIIGEGYTPPAIAILTGILTGFSYALNNILTSAAVKKNPPDTVTLYTLIFSSVFLIPFSGGGELIELIKANPRVLLVALLMALVTGVAAQYVFSIGLSRIESGNASIYGAAEPVVGTLIGILVFREESNLLKIVGIVLVIAAIVLVGKTASEDKTA